MAPSSLCTPISTTVRAKLGSRSAGEASSSWPVSDSSIGLIEASARIRNARNERT